MAKQSPSPSEKAGYKVDFTWKKLKGIVTDNQTNEHIMDIDCSKMTKPHLKFQSPQNETIGTANFHAVSIHAECEVRGRPKKIQAMKRWTTEYTYLSDAFANGGSPAPMYWTSSSGFKHWDFILLDSNREPVARFHSNVWAVTKLGLLEFMGDYSAETKEEICITGFSVYYNWLLRMNNVFQVFGAIGAKTGPIETNTNNANIRVDNVSAQESDVRSAVGTAPVHVESSSDTMIR